MAANRGWLDCSWEDESIDENLVPEPVLVPLKDIEEISKGVGEKLAIHQDKLDIRQDKLVIHQDKIPIHQNKFAVHQDKLAVHQDKLVIHQDSVQYDENGAIMEQQPRVPKGGKKKKMIEVNETQISTYFDSSLLSHVLLTS
jgi:checkpoint serine/threonine-protein kinase